MTIHFEEMTADVVPDRGREGAQDEPRAGGGGEAELDEKIRSALVRERHRLERLSDR